MSVPAISTAPAYLREARLQAGCVNRGTATTKVPYSPETIGRHERGEVQVTPTDALIYAQGYEKPEILIRYCSDCPIGRKIRPEVQDDELSHIILQLLNRAPKMMSMITRLGEITDDKKIDNEESADFEKVMAYLDDWARVTGTFQLWAMSQGLLQPTDKERAAPGATGNGSM